MYTLKVESGTFHRENSPASVSSSNARQSKRYTELRTFFPSTASETKRAARAIFPMNGRAERFGCAITRNFCRRFAARLYSMFSKMRCVHACARAHLGSKWSVNFRVKD